ncbi:hypothetical protein ABZZ20_06065 [Streptomyces sp. NPDC006430]|uniref:hypothetical protein n=1 Tax=Streptomyces sp. NPDC006430 TaxID=3154299 RepID=UPI0033A37174
MTFGSVARRSWRSFTGTTYAHRPPTGVRARAGYTLWQRLWASFIGADLPSAPLATAPVLPGGYAEKPTGNRHPVSGAARDRSRPQPLAAGWFRLPQLPKTGGLAAAGGDTVLLEASSPDGSARFLVRRHGGSVPGYSLELVVHGVEGAAPLMTAVRYADGTGSERVLLVPVVRARYGPAASYVRLPGYVGQGWTASVTVPVGPDSTWDVAAVTLSVGASLNDATRDAWREVRALISEPGLRRAIDQELR